MANERVKNKLGMIPNEWEAKRLSNLVGKNALFTDGDWIESKDQDQNGETRLIQLADIGDGHFINKSSRFLTREKAKKLNCTFLQPGDILIARMPDPIGRACLFPQLAQSAVTAVDVCIIRPESQVNTCWLIYCINSAQIRLDIRRKACGTTRSRISRSSLEKLFLAVPPAAEQEKIADILGEWDSAIFETEKLISLKKNLKKALCQQLLTSKYRFKEFKGQKWKTVTLKEFLVPQIRAVVKPLKSFLALGIRSHGKGTFQKPNFEPQKIALEELYQVKTDDLIVNITFAWEGAIAIVNECDDDALVSHRFPTYVFDRQKVVPEYFRHVILQKRFVYELGLVSPGGAGRNRVLSKKDFLKIKVDIPTVEEQQKIASVLNAADKEIELLNKKLESLKQQKKGLMQKLLTGKIRVKV